MTPNASTRTILLGRGKPKKTVTITYAYLVTPSRTGRIEIPAIEVTADGKTYTTEPQVILVTESETGELLFVELYADKETVYVGDSLTIKLQIWLRPYRDRKYQLDEENMWQRVDQRNSTWGPFAEILANRRNRVAVRNAFRTDSVGDEHSYFVYELKKTIWAEEAGQYDPGDITILVSYPEEIGRVRDPFEFSFISSRRNRVTKSRPIVQSAEVTPIEIQPIPVVGQPVDYAGAVGQFKFNVSARPTDVAVGDPITLSLSISGTGRLDMLQPPPLLEWTELTEAFKIPTDPMAGVVQGRRKQFTQSIRPRSDTVDEIPAIPFSYFDPRTEKFVTVYSNPIPVTVKLANIMSVADVVDATGGGPVATELRELSGGILANYTGLDEVLSHQAFAPGVGSAAALGLPPMLFLACLVFQRHRDRLQRDPRAARRRSAHRRAMIKIQQSREHGDTELAEVLATALTDFVADRYGLPTGGLTRTDAIEQLNRWQLPADLVEQVDNLLETCESLKFAGLDSAAGQNLAARAADCINQLERERQ